MKEHVLYFRLEQNPTKQKAEILWKQPSTVYQPIIPIEQQARKRRMHK